MASSVGEPLSERMLLFDALSARIRIVSSVSNSDDFKHLILIYRVNYIVRPCGIGEITSPVPRLFFCMTDPL